MDELPATADTATITIDISDSNNNNSNCSSNNAGDTPPKVSAFFSSSSNYQSRVQQLISFSFTSSFHLIFITSILSISKFCNAAAVNAAQVTASAPSPSLIISNLSGSALLERIMKTTTLGPQLDKLKSSAPAAANSISGSSAGGNSFGSSFFNSKGINLSRDFSFQNVSGKINTPLDICKWSLYTTKTKLSYWLLASSAIYKWASMENEKASLERSLRLQLTSLGVRATCPDICWFSFALLADQASEPPISQCLFI